MILYMMFDMCLYMSLILHTDMCICTYNIYIYIYVTDATYVCIRIKHTNVYIYKNMFKHIYTYV